MKKLVFIDNAQVLTTSLKVAEFFGKNHAHLVRDIENLLAQMPSEPALNIENPKLDSLNMFQKDYYQVEGQTRKYPMYFMNRDGFTLLAMGFTGKKALQFKLAYIDAFNKMEEKLKELADANYRRFLETRAGTKISRRSETDTIKLFIEYARAQGCTLKESSIYAQITIWCNVGAGLPQKGGRDGATIQQLNTIDLLEGTVVKNILINSMAEGLHWTQILARVKQQINAFLQITFQTPALLK